jgi:Outer membrane lipoprotein-sorting protein
MRIVLWLLLVLTSTPLLFADRRGDEIIARYLDQAIRRDAVVTMSVGYQELNKPAVHLELTWMRKLRQGLVSHLIRLEAPLSEKGKLLLVREKPNGEADYIAYRPNSSLKKKVKVSGARNYKYRGLTISVQELAGGELGKYEHESRGEQTINGVGCFVVENQIKAQFKNASSYPRSRCYLRKDNGMLQQWELFGNSNQLEKVIAAEEIKQIDGVWTVSVARIDELKRQGKLILRLKDVDYHPRLQDSLFDEKYLKENSK